MASATKDLIAQMQQARFNPGMIKRVMLNTLEGTTGGTIDLVDASSPFPFLMEMAATLGAAEFTNNAVNTRKQYPAMALSMADLYLHMSDRDYIGNFASPGMARVRLLFDKDEIYRNVVPTGVGNIAQITVPRETYFTVGTYRFTMQYPINIRVMGHGGLQIVYDVSQPSPLQNLSTNVVTWSILNIAGTEYLELDLPVYQMQISTSYGSINAATGFSMSYGFPDQYYYTRVYAATSQGGWTELRTTYTAQVFDPTVPTAVLTLLGSGRLQVDIPQIYLTSGQLTTELRVDIYSTKGPLDVSLADYQLNAWTVNFIDLNSSTDTSYVSPYVAPLAGLSLIQVGSNDTITGGSNAISFDVLRQRVMANALGENSLPITTAQLAASLSNLGYDSVQSVDDVTHRSYLATRTLPAPTDGSVSSGIGCAIMTLQRSMNELTALSTVSDNGNRITLQPQTLYQTVNGVVNPVNDATVASLKAMNRDALVAAINSGSYVYTPFHYVLDINDNEFNSRAYYLDAPQVTAKSFIAENDTLGMSVATGQYQLVRTYANSSTGEVDGYALYVITQSEAVFEGLDDSQISVQLSFVPEGEVDRAYLNGILMGHCDPDGTPNSNGVERWYKFPLGTQYDLDSKDNLGLTTFSMYDNEPVTHFSALKGTFDLIYAVSGVVLTGTEHSSIDQELNPTHLPSNSYGITQERFTLQLGYAMTGLWQRARSVVGSQDYARYTTEVPWTYTQDIYKRDAVTGNIEITNNNGTLEYTLLHRAGDPVLDPDTGEQLIKFHVGDVIVDGSGNPQVIATRNMLRQTDILFLDGLYWFANATAAVDYANTIPQLIYGWLTNDIAVVSEDLLEQTELSLYPKSTMGLVQGTVVADQTVTVEARLSFTVDYYLTGVGYRNPELRTALTQLAATTLAAAVEQPTVAMDKVAKTLSDAAGDDVIALKVSGLGGAQNNFTTLTTLDDSIRLSIGKSAYAAPDGTIGIKDAITVNFIQHTKN